MIILGPFEYLLEKKVLSENQSFLNGGAMIAPF